MGGLQMRMPGMGPPKPKPKPRPESAAPTLLVSTEQKARVALGRNRETMNKKRRPPTRKSMYGTMTHADLMNVGAR